MFKITDRISSREKHCLLLTCSPAVQDPEIAVVPLLAGPGHQSEWHETQTVVQHCKAMYNQSDLPPRVDTVIYTHATAQLPHRRAPVTAAHVTDTARVGLSLFWFGYDMYHSYPKNLFVRVMMI